MTTTPCLLGEGAMWHPGLGRLFWVDVLSRRLHWHEDGRTGTHQFDEMISAAAWIDEGSLLVATEAGLVLHDLGSGRSETLAPLEADRPETRSNDGRADPWGGFWIGTMGKQAEKGAGAIYRYFRGEVRLLFPGLSIPNAICFAPGGEIAYFADTPRQTVWRQGLGPDGWPAGEPEVWLRLEEDGLFPDGAVVDTEGRFWCAEWGAGRVACHAPDGSFLRAVEGIAAHASCPAFGGAEMTTLYCTTARQGISEARLAAEPDHGRTFAATGVAQGQAEHRVIL